MINFHKLQQKIRSTELPVVFVKNQLQREIANVTFYVSYVNKDSVKELLYGANIVVMVVTPSNINSGSVRIRLVLMDVNINVSDLKILIDFSDIFEYFY